MKLNLKELLRTKTFWTGVSMIATGIGMVVAGDTAAGIQTILAGLTTIFVRDALITTNK